MKLVGASVACLLSCVFAACGVRSPGQQTPSARIDTVDIEQTAVEDQGKFGLCWAYATVGLVESVHKAETGRDIDLSEEAVGFFRLAHAIREILVTMPTMDIISSFIRPGLIGEGWFPRLPEGALDKPAVGDNMDALDLMKTYGVVPEAAWNHKVPNEEAKAALFAQIRKNGIKFLDKRIPRNEITVEMVMDEILVGAFPSRPPTEFEYEGQRYTAQEFLASLNFDPDDYTAVAARSDADYDKVVAATKRALVRGVSVPLMYPISIRRLHGDLFTGDNLPTETVNDLVAFTMDGGHVVLVSDFVNVGSRPGLLSPREIRHEFSRPAKDLDYLVFKNSWGKRALTNEAGLPLGGGSETGYYRMDQSYLRAASKVGAFPGWSFLGVVVPKDIAEDPFGSDPDPSQSLPRDGVTR